MKAVDKSKNTGAYSISEVCSRFELKRDAYYKYLNRFKEKLDIKDKVLKLVKNRRKTLAREGTRKLYKALHYTFKKNGFKVGRDTLFEILREEDMLIKRKKSFVKTTNSYHHFHKYNNLIKNIKASCPNQIWVSDITYIRSHKGFCYLALITDLYSRKIVGYDVSSSLELEGCLRALKRAFKTAGKINGLIHHSDRGVQYCSHMYVNQLKKRNVKISMTEENHCYENAVAERVNGILKDEFYLDQTFNNENQIKQATNNAIALYTDLKVYFEKSSHELPLC
jgi:transposase InsO family protein